MNGYFNEELYDNMMNKYADYITIMKDIINLNTNDITEIFNKIKKYLERNECEAKVFMYVISISLMSNSRHKRGLWELYNILKIEFNTDIDNRMKTSNLQQLILLSSKNADLEPILNPIDPNSINFAIFNDDIKQFKDLYSSKYNFKELLEVCAWNGSIQCFKFLRSNGAKITSNCLIKSFMGRNKEIINECLNFQEPNNNCMRMTIKIHEIETAIWLKDQYGLNIGLDNVQDFVCLPLFIYLICQTKNFDEYLAGSPPFRLTSLVQDLLDLGADINYINMDSLPALSAAVVLHSIPIVKKLIENHANIDVCDSSNVTPLMIAVISSDPDIVKLLIKNGANIHVVSKFGSNLLTSSCSLKDSEVTRILIDHGVEIDFQDSSGRTPLMIAVQHHSIKNVKILIEKGADVNKKDKFGNTALSLSKTMEIRSFLLVNGAIE